MLSHTLNNDYNYLLYNVNNLKSDLSHIFVDFLK